tara:strand:- start:457 stop:699 length:243 start_codon:yes stop_codon:yes gene_type:complete
MMTLEQAFAKAVNSKANRLDDGTVDWNYVDSDCAMDMELASSYQSKESDDFNMIDCEDFYNRFDALANQYEKAPFEATGV